MSVIGSEQDRTDEALGSTNFAFKNAVKAKCSKITGWEMKPKPEEKASCIK